jgi:hypothetical protein
MLSAARFDIQLRRLAEIQAQLRAALLADDLDAAGRLSEECGARLAGVLDAASASPNPDQQLPRLRALLAVHRELEQLVERQLPVAANALRKAGDLRRVAHCYAAAPAAVRQEQGRTTDLHG